MRAIASFFCGLVFGCGLLISGMTEPPIVLGFLDVLGHWNPTLAFVMGGALVVSAVGFAFARRQPAPVFAERFDWPTQGKIDAALVVGSILFGIGWGLVGLCPGPAIENLATPSTELIVFVLAMIAGMGLYGWRQTRLPSAEGREPAIASDG
ncbi:hypothetical protein SAMN02745126_05015 [Enhydrobacter aerosaccus]|uniref:Sulphur transport domain-containing protein n=1 Tax=Enhydrobacter aerosaccus TaxID=225324 RepID=A0A1T4SRC8_9HYPH|nr:YeeE/YedE family protein [Enhydrobacter aerosaccus]SKA30737.1 hypothetical protein SAMN02745126_05015 [Enhydrobacter aerosaccus]